MCLTVSVLIAAACAPAVTPTATPVPTTPVGVQLSWTHTIEFAGLHEADDKGFYNDAGLDVDLRAGGYDAEGNFIAPIDQVASGAAEFGVADSGELLIARAQGAPVVAIASIYQRSPLTLMSLPERDITRPEELVGLDVQVYPSISGAPFRALLASQGVDPDTVNLIERTDFTTAPLTNGEADVIDGWVTNEAITLQTEGVEFNQILLSDYGIDMYPNVIITHEETIAERPELVRAFLEATMRGTEAAIEDPEHAAQLAVALNEENTIEKETEAMQRSLPLINPAGSEPGLMQPEIWQLTHDTLLEQGLLEAPQDVEAAYNLTFLNELYAESE